MIVCYNRESGNIPDVFALVNFGLINFRPDLGTQLIFSGRTGKYPWAPGPGVVLES